jgi:hypothetical protein
MANEIILYEYKFIGISGYVYYPKYRNGKWCPDIHNECTLVEIASIFDIPEDDLIILKLRYGG